MTTSFVSTAIPYVNASPHIGFALELVIADVVARYARQNGERCHFVSGTDDNSLKNALAAEQAGLSASAFVTARASEFRELKELLNISYDDFLSTSTDARHAPAVEALWRRCQRSGDIYESEYEGLYCIGCEQFYAPAELQEGVCPEHRTKPESIRERNYFFRLSRYQDELIRLIERDGERFQTFWNTADRISHVIGKGVTRFHAVYWPAILLSAGVRVPSQLLVHGYVTIDGQKISKSLGNAISPLEAQRRFGTDALRYYLLRHIGSQRDGDFSWSRFDEVYTHELANDLGNLVSRTTALGRQHGVPPLQISFELADGLTAEVARYVEEFALDRALGSIWRVVANANAYINQKAPWVLVKQGRHDELAGVLAELYGTLGCLGHALAPFLPDTSARLLSSLSSPSPAQLFPKSSAGRPAAEASESPGMPA